MRFGYHLPPPLPDIPGWLSDHKAVVFQTYLREKTRLNSDGIPTAQEQEDYLAVVSALDVPLWGMAHASLIANIASPDPKLRNASAAAIVKDANLAARLGFAGVCFHVGYQKGHDTRQAAHALAARKYAEAVSKLNDGAQLWLENGCEGTELGQTVEELALVLNAALDTGINPQSVGIVIDTCHLHVAGFDLAAPDAPDRLAAELESHRILPFLRVLHLNDAQEACGSKRDRHAAPGSGTINVGLRHLAQHPVFAPLPAILELSPANAALGIAWMEGAEDDTLQDGATLLGSIEDPT